MSYQRQELERQRQLEAQKRKEKRHEAARASGGVVVVVVLCLVLYQIYFTPDIPLSPIKLPTTDDNKDKGRSDSDNDSSSGDSPASGKSTNLYIAAYLFNFVYLVSLFINLKYSNIPGLLEIQYLLGTVTLVLSALSLAEGHWVPLVLFVFLAIHHINQVKKGDRIYKEMEMAFLEENKDGDAMTLQEKTGTEDITSTSDKS